MERHRKIIDGIFADLKTKDLDFSFMHVCGTHQESMLRNGLLERFTDVGIRILQGPGCPVCITPASVIVTSIALALHSDNPIFCTYGDMVRIPTSEGSILDSRMKGADVRIVYSIRDAISLALENPGRTVVFLSVGFETTAAPVASIVKAGLPDNFFIYCCHRYVPAAVEALTALESFNPKK